MKRPLVYATDRATRLAAQLLPGRILENEVQAAIVNGDVTCGTRGGVVFLDADRLVARIVRTPGRLRERPRAWLVTDLTGNRNEEEQRDNRAA